MALDLVNTCVFLLALSLLQGLVARLFRKQPRYQKIVSGLLFGGACLYGMNIQIDIGNGASIDSRLLILSLGGLYGGPVVAALSCALVSAYLLALGLGSVTDLLLLLLAVLLGLGFRAAESRGRIKSGFMQLLALGFVVHAGAGLLLNLAAESAPQAQWDHLSLPVVLVFSLGTALLGTLLADVQHRARVELALIESQALMSHHIENTPLAAISWDQGFRCTQWNKAAERIFGFSADEAIGKHGAELLVPGALQREMVDQYRELIENASSSQKINENVTREGRTIVCEWYNTPIIDDDGKAIGIASLGEDITAKREAEKLIWEQANYDALTGLANRKLLQDRLDQEIKKANRAGHSIALLYLDLDRFKDVNDSLGHHVGDKLLQEAAARLTTHIRAVDTVARLGGDEFIIVMGSLEDFSNVERVATTILEKMSEPFELDHEVIYVSASIGITLYPQDGAQIDELLKNADQAMYAAKNTGRNCYQYFKPSMQHISVNRIKMVKDLHSALTNDEFVLHYQPIVDLHRGRICKSEALIRWQHSEHGLLTPDHFISYAEETRLINRIGDWVFQQALERAARWRDIYDPDFQVCINASPVQFNSRRRHAADWVELLAENGLPGNAVAIEITENLLMQNVDSFTNRLKRIRSAGIQVSLDDFGTGYSSLSYLKRFDIDYLKIDRSFVSNLGLDSDDMVLCHAIIAMAHKLGLKVVAEGIETRQQQALLKSAGCDFGQGFLFSKALPETEFEQLLENFSAAS